MTLSRGRWFSWLVIFSPFRFDVRLNFTLLRPESAPDYRMEKVATLLPRHGDKSLEQSRDESCHGHRWISCRSTIPWLKLLRGACASNGSTMPLDRDLRRTRIDTRMSRTTRIHTTVRGLNMPASTAS